MIDIFKVGDVLTGIKGSGKEYYVTNEFSTVKVIRVIKVYKTDVSDITVEVLTQDKQPNEIGEQYPVCSKWFVLYKKKLMDLEMRE